MSPHFFLKLYACKSLGRKKYVCNMYFMFDLKCDLFFFFLYMLISVFCHNTCKSFMTVENSFLTIAVVALYFHPWTAAESCRMGFKSVLGPQPVGSLLAF